MVHIHRLLFTSGLVLAAIAKPVYVDDEIPENLSVIESRSYKDGGIMTWYGEVDDLESRLRLPRAASNLTKTTPIDTNNSTFITLPVAGSEQKKEKTPNMNNNYLISNGECGKLRLDCKAEHTFFYSARHICERLILSTIMEGEDIVQRKPRHVCYEFKEYGPKCCLSWADETRTMRKRQLTKPAKAIMNLCGGEDAMFGGRMHNVALGAQCTTLCLSRNPKRCQN